MTFRLGGASIVSTVKSHHHLIDELWLAVDEVVHHDDVMLAIVIRPRGNVAGLDPDRRDAGVVKLDREEGQASVSRRGGTLLWKRSLPVLSKYSIKVLLCAVAVRAPLPSGWSTSVNTAPKPLTVAGVVPLVPGMEKDASVMLLPTGVNNRDRLNAVKILA